jgi:hypothetical protein
MNQDKQSELLPCPFCGGEPDLVLCVTTAYVRCMQAGCDTTGPVAPRVLGHHGNEAISLWNTRPSLSTPSEGVIERAVDDDGEPTPEELARRDVAEIFAKHGPIIRAAIEEALARLSPLPLVEEGAPAVSNEAARRSSEKINRWVGRALSSAREAGE